MQKYFKTNRQMNIIIITYRKFNVRNIISKQRNNYRKFNLRDLYIFKQIAAKKKLIEYSRKTMNKTIYRITEKKILLQQVK